MSPPCYGLSFLFPLYLNVRNYITNMMALRGTTLGGDEIIKAEPSCMEPVLL